MYRSDSIVQTSRGARSAITTIYYLLEQNQFSHWHVIDSDEVWHFYAGASIEVLGYDPQTKQLERHILGDPLNGGGSVAVIPAGHWQAARALNGFVLMGCTVSPGFEFSEFHFVSAPPEQADHFMGVLAPFAELI